jgi:glycosyltransferase involved in cell wall biosynthesis
VALAKVLIVTFDPVPAPDGKSVRVETLLQALQGRYDVDLLTPKVGDAAHIEIRHGARLLRVPLGRGHLHTQVETFARAVRRQLAADEYRLVHLCDPRVAGPACELFAERGFRVVYEPLGAALLDLERSFPEVRRNLALADRLRAAEVLCVSTAHAVIVGTTIARGYVGALAPCADRVHVLPGSVDVPWFHARLPGAPKRRLALSDADLPVTANLLSSASARQRSQSRAAPFAPKADDGALPRPLTQGGRVVYVGELAPWQGIGTLVRAARDVVRARPSTRFLLAGPAPAGAFQAIAALARQLEVDAAVEICPAVGYPKVAELLRGADVCVVPSELDERATSFGPFAQKAAECFAAGRATVVSQTPGQLELTEGADSPARSFEPGRADALAAALLEVLGDDELRAGLGSVAFAFASQHVAAPHFRERLLAIYQSVISGTHS